MNEVKLIRIGYLTGCITIAMIIPHLIAEGGVPVFVQIMIQLAFLTIGLVVYIKTGD